MLLYLILLSFCHVSAQFPCACDDIDNSCDANCCCDTDCSPEQKSLFSKCDNVEANSGYCVDKNFVLFNHSTFPTTLVDTRFLCIERDNHHQRYFYPTDGLVWNIGKYKELGVKEDKTAQIFQPPVERIRRQKYKQGDPVYTVESGKILKLTLPSLLYGTKCIGKYNVQYLTSHNEVCDIDFDQSLCTKMSVISADRYPRSFVKQPTDLPAECMLGRTCTNLSTTAAVKAAVGDVSPPSQSGNTTSSWCSHVVSDISYTFIIDATTGIDSVVIDLIFQAVNMKASTVRVSSRVTFEWVRKNDAPRLVNNPGYGIGSSLLVGFSHGEEGTEPGVTALDGTMSILSPIGDGRCDNDSRKDVEFKYDLASACYIIFKKNPSTQQCRNHQLHVRDILTGSPFDRVGNFASSNAKDFDWLNILRTGDDTSSSAVNGWCSNIPSGLDITIIYARQGDYLDPETKILAVVYSFLPPGHVESNTDEVKVYLATTVTFVDKSSKVEPRLAALPTIDAKLPLDIFYPFGMPAKASQLGVSVVTFVSALLVLFLE